jgi:hypothetical protein
MIFVFCFVFLPLYLLDSIVMPELMTLKSVYENAGANAAHIAAQSSQETTQSSL